MKALFTLATALVFAATVTASTNNLITNGSFTNSYAGWTTNGPATKFLFTTNTPDGSTAAYVTNRSNTQNTIKQDLLAALTNEPGANGGTFTTRYRIRLDAPSSTRLALTLVSGGVSTKFILAEKVVRTNGVWFDVQNTVPLAWTGSLTSASLSVDVGQSWESANPPFALTRVQMWRDTDGDGIPDAEETTTDPNLADTDGDGMSDYWELRFGLNANSNTNKFADGDGDGWTDFEEFMGATCPTNNASRPGQPRRAGLTDGANAVIEYLARLPARETNRVLLGQHITTTDAEWTNHVLGLFQKTGKWPSVVSFAVEGINGPLQIQTNLAHVFEQATNGGLVLLKWAVWNPWTTKQASDTNRPATDIPGLLDPSISSPANLATNTFAHSNYFGWLQTIATNLVLLRDAGIPVLWRPCSEMNGTWFWWGRKSQADYLALWRHMHDYLVLTNGLTNLIWVYESDQSVHDLCASDYFYPGDDLVDVMGHNFYDDTWDLPFDSDGVYRSYAKIFAVPQAGKSKAQYANTNWSNLTYLHGVSNTIPRCAFFCVWNTFGSGASIAYIATTDNANAQELVDDPRVTTRNEVNWKYYLPFALGVEPAGANQLRVNWQGGALQHSVDLMNWTNVPNATQPYLHDLTGAPADFWRLKR